MIGIIIGIVVILIIFIIIFSIYSNKFHFAIIKIEKAEEDIDMYLQKKKDLLDRTRPIIKKELKLKNFLTELDDDLSEKNNFEVNDFLRKMYNDLFKILDENEK